MGEILMVDTRSVYFDVKFIESNGEVYANVIDLAHQFAEIAKDSDWIVDSQELSRFFLTMARKKSN